MLSVEKKVGETPLEVLERIRREHPGLVDKNGKPVVLSYAGRLDPMAEGVMLVLVGEEENRPESRAKFLSLDKEYVATFLVGVKTDTGDCLGLVADSGALESSGLVDESIIRAEVDMLRSIKKQIYPWFSGKTVDGVKLFDHFKAGNTNIKRPSQDIEIKEVEFLGSEQKAMREICKYVFDSVSAVHGDFRQKEILTRWTDFFEKHKEKNESHGLCTSEKMSMMTFRVRFVVSSGTFIRAFIDEFTFPATLLSLKRTRIIM